MARRRATAYVLLAIQIGLATASELQLKTGAADAAARKAVGTFGAAALGSWWTWTGIVTYIGAFSLWTQVLRWLPLNKAYSIDSVLFVLVPICAWLALREPMPPARWVATALVAAGAFLVATGSHHPPADRDVIPAAATAAAAGDRA
jgi:drug/metabolite transporter (DMT)-like permease